jgi:hypothetical protein
MITGVAKRSTTTLRQARSFGVAFPLRFCTRWGLGFSFYYRLGRRQALTNLKSAPA